MHREKISRKNTKHNLSLDIKEVSKNLFPCWDSILFESASPFFVWLQKNHLLVLTNGNLFIDAQMTVLIPFQVLRSKSINFHYPKRKKEERIICCFVFIRQRETAKKIRKL